MSTPWKQQQQPDRAPKEQVGLHRELCLLPRGRGPKACPCIIAQAAAPPAAPVQPDSGMYVGPGGQLGGWGGHARGCRCALVHTHRSRQARMRAPSRPPAPCRTRAVHKGAPGAVHKERESPVNMNAARAQHDARQRGQLGTDVADASKLAQDWR